MSNGKKCRVCGKSLDGIKSHSYCSKECMASWYKEHPRYSKTCKRCGKEFKTNIKAQKYCSRACNSYSISSTIGYKQDHEKRMARNEQQFIENFNRKFSEGFEYISGYVGNNSIITIRCKIHNVIFTRTASFLRKGDEPNCPICQEIAREQKKQLSAEQRRIKQEELDEARQQEREQKREQDIKNRTRECAYCGKAFISKYGNTCCSDKCKRKKDNRIKDISRREKLRANGKIDWSLSLPKLIKRDKNVCYICHGKCNVDDCAIDDNGYFIAGDTYPSIDHVFPVSKGGTHTWDNVRLAHRKCNSMKCDGLCYGEEGKQMRLVL